MVEISDEAWRLICTEAELDTPASQFCRLIIEVASE